MIILDTNVVSEPLRSKPNPEVLAWLDRQAPETLYLTTINVAELWSGVEALPAGRRRTQLQALMSANVLALFENRILPFDEPAATAFGRIAANAQAAGNRIDFADCAIAAIAMTKNFMLATRNIKDFRGVDVELINPWGAAAE
ncbi:MAG TPA: type II toxin-antitoxin system VapC family toxin [Steroidobacteraceae bacterium]